MDTASAKILLLEDNPADRHFMAACLDGHGKADVDLRHAVRLAEAKTRLEDQDFELIIADLNLPDADGLETFFRVREWAPNSAIVVMTGMDDSNLAAKAVQEGAQDYLVKGDLSPEKVWRSVSNALERNGRMRRLAKLARTLRRENDGLKEQARIDSLTGLLNREGAQKALKRLAPRESRRICALSVDVDGFRRINDLLGYAHGDRALRRVGSVIREQLRPDDSAARLGRDDFLVLLAPATLQKGLEVAEKIRQGVAEQSVPSSGGTFKVTVSVGVAEIAEGPPSLEELLVATHAALRLGKMAGKNRVGSVDASAGGGPPVLTQSPFFNLSDSSLAGSEFLFEEHPAFGGFPHAGGSEQLRRQFEAVALHGGGRECHLRLSHAQLFQLKPEDLAVAMPPGLDRSRLRLSIQEVPMNPLPPGLVDSVRRLQREGWMFAVRDLKLEANDWANLILLEPAAVTLHRDVVAGVAGDTGRLRSLVRLHRALGALGAYIIADGVESGGELEILASLGVPYGRGGFWGRPAPVPVPDGPVGPGTP